MGMYENHDFTVPMPEVDEGEFERLGSIKTLKVRRIAASVLVAQMTHKALTVSTTLADFQKNLNQAAGKAGPEEGQEQQVFQEPRLRKGHQHCNRQRQSDIIKNAVMLILPGGQQSGDLSGEDMAATGQPDLAF